MQRTVYFVVFLASILMQGCVTPYKVPPGTPTASVVFATTSNGVRVQAYDDTSCTRSPYGNRLAYFFLSTADPHTGVEKEIAATKQFVYTFAMASGVAPITNTSSCEVTTAFQPQPGQKYKAVFQVGGEQCVSLLYRVNGSSSEADHLVLESTAQRITPACVNNLTD